VNLTLSLIKGLLFGFTVTLVACHFGLRIKPNTESLSVSTTSSVVTAVTSVILIDAWFAIITRGMGV
jgi:phospholipid/cholesterol/gamma-HCH transport system permease protein